MENKPNQSQSNQLIIGIILVAIGTLFLIDNFSIFGASIISVRNVMQFWPLILILIGVIKIVQEPNSEGARNGVVLVIIGMVFLAGKFGLFDLSLRIIVPCMLIAVGIWILGRHGFFKVSNQSAAPVSLDKMGSAETEPPLNISAIMGGYQRRVTSKAFSGGNVLVLMGGCEIDMRHTSIEGEVVLDINVLFGGLELKVPTDWTVITQGSAILGSIDEQTLNPPNGAKRLIVRGTVMFGGVEVRN